MQLVVCNNSLSPCPGAPWCRSSPASAWPYKLGGKHVEYFVITTISFSNGLSSHNAGFFGNRHGIATPSGNSISIIGFLDVAKLVLLKSGYFWQL
jgi:hypothetical protein